MIRKLLLASAGAGKSTLIAESSISESKAGGSTLILTYTEKNQEELKNTISAKIGIIPSSIKVKGWFTFLLEDLIRPYQRAVFEKRISGIFFNQQDPHKRNGRNIPGRTEILNGRHNADYYTTRSENKAHTTYLAKLAKIVLADTNNNPIRRLEAAYTKIFIDEVQDLVGWDFEIIRALAKSYLSEVSCVGDFRQTLYSTSIANKTPKNSLQKVDRFKALKFQVEHLSHSWRCVQEVCTFADLVHKGEGFALTTSKVALPPEPFCYHLGVHAVSRALLPEYFAKYSPTILRVSRSTANEICDGRPSYNFGESKGLGFDRVLIIPTEKHLSFISGKFNVFSADRTDKAKNSLYVAITRARYSVAFLCEDTALIDEITRWAPLGE